MTTKFYPTIRNSFFNDSFDILSHLDNLFLPHENRSRLKDVRSHTVPKANVYKTEVGYQIELAAPGFTRDEFLMSVDNNMLSVEVHTEDAIDNTEKLCSSEWNYNSFKRNWALPENTNIDGISARYDAGILYVEVPQNNVKETKRNITVE